MIAALYGERLQLLAQKRGGVGSDDESFASCLLKGRPFICFDNRRGRFDSTQLEAFLTAPDEFMARAPYQPPQYVNVNNYLLSLTSNNAEMTVDLSKRSSFVRIRKRPSFAFTIYPEGYLIDHVRHNRCWYLGSVFSIINAWINYGRPQTGETGHDFREWCQTLDWIVQNLFRLPPLLTDHGQAQERVVNTALSFVRALTNAIQAGSRGGQQLTATDLARVCLSKSIPIPGSAGGDERGAAKQIGVLFHQLFGSGTAFDVESARIEKQPFKRKRLDGKGNSPGWAYVFSLSASPPPTPARVE